MYIYICIHIFVNTERCYVMLYVYIHVYLILIIRWLVNMFKSCVVVLCTGIFHDVIELFTSLYKCWLCNCINWVRIADIQQSRASTCWMHRVITQSNTWPGLQRRLARNIIFYLYPTLWLVTQFLKHPWLKNSDNLREKPYLRIRGFSLFQPTSNQNIIVFHSLQGTRSHSY